MLTITSQSEQIEILNPPAIPGLRFRRFRGQPDFPHMMRVLAASEVADGNERVITLEEISNTYDHLVNCDPDRDVLMAEIQPSIGASRRNTSQACALGRSPSRR